jgi:hypothetical protein
MIAKTNSESINEVNVSKKNQSELLAYPNPASSDIHLVFELNRSEKNILVQVYDMNARLAKQQILNYLEAGKQNITVKLDNLTSGYIRFA